MEDYEIVELIAQGGYGVVLKALQKSTGQMVAIKQFRDNDQQTLQIAQREISVLKLMQGHPNIIKLLNAFQHRSKMFLVFELMQQTLLDVLQGAPDGRLEREQVRSLVRQMVTALAHMHTQNAVHRDVKPENMLVSRVPLHEKAYEGEEIGKDKNNRVRGQSLKVVSDRRDGCEEDSVYVLKVCDFGQARGMDSEGSLTEYVSTRWYRAPELLVGSKIYDKSIDIWAIGCMVPELITGRPLFPGNSNFEALAFVLKTFGNNLTVSQMDAFHQGSAQHQFRKLPQIKKVVSLNERLPELTDEEIDFVKKCLVLNPKERSSAENLLKHPYLTLPDVSQQLSEEVKMPDQQSLDVPQSVESSVQRSSFPYESSEEDLCLSHSNSNKSEDAQLPNDYLQDSQKQPSSNKESRSSHGNKTKKRPSSSFNHGTNSVAQASYQYYQQQAAEQREKVNSRDYNNANSSNSNIHSKTNINQDYGLESGKEEPSNLGVDGNSAKQLPKPILFLRKQKEAREHHRHTGSLKGVLKVKPEQIDRSNAVMGDNSNPFEMGPEMLQQQQQAFQYYEQQRIKITKQQQFKSPQIMKSQGKVGEILGYPKEPQNMLISTARAQQVSSKQKLRQEQQIEQEQLQEALSQKIQLHQLMTAQKNQVLYQGGQIPKMQRSPPIGQTNPKLMMINERTVTKQQDQQSYNQTPQIPYKISQHRLSNPLNQPRNISVPLKEQEEVPQTHYRQPYQQHIFSQGNGHALSYSPKSFVNNKSNNPQQQAMFPPVNKEPQNNNQNPLLNTQKHVTSKLVALPQIAQQQNKKENKIFIKKSSIKNITNSNAPSDAAMPSNTVNQVRPPLAHPTDSPRDPQVAQPRYYRELSCTDKRLDTRSNERTHLATEAYYNGQMRQTPSKMMTRNSHSKKSLKQGVGSINSTHEQEGKNGAYPNFKLRNAKKQ